MWGGPSLPPDSARILIYDSSNLLCELLATGLNSLGRGFEIRHAHDRESVDALLQTDPHWVILISDTGPNGAALALARHLRARFTGVRFIFLLQDREREGRRDRMIEAFRAGARGVVYSNENLSQLAKCVEHVFRGEIWARRSDLAIIFEGLLTTRVPVTDALGKTLLSAREEELAGLVAEGMSNREIARSLKISESTVKNSLFHIFDKLGISNRVELSRYVSRSSEADRRLPEGWTRRKPGNGSLKQIS